MVIESGHGEAIPVNILELVDELKNELDAARKMPIGGGVIVDRVRMLEILDDLRTAIPTNIKQARAIVDRSAQAMQEAQESAGRIVGDADTRAQQILAQARYEAERLVADAERDAEERLNESMVVRAAQERAYQLEHEAKARADRTVAEARARAEQTLAEAEERARAQEADADRYAVMVFEQLDQRLTGYLGGIRQARAQFEGQGSGQAAPQQRQGAFIQQAAPPQDPQAGERRG